MLTGQCNRHQMKAAMLHGSSLIKAQHDNTIAQGALFGSMRLWVLHRAAVALNSSQACSSHSDITWLQTRKYC